MNFSENALKCLRAHIEALKNEVYKIVESEDEIKDLHDFTIQSFCNLLLVEIDHALYLEKQNRRKEGI